MWNGTYKLSESTAARRIIYLFLVGTDGVTAATGEAAGQPQIAKNTGAFANTSDTLHTLGNGHYYITATAAEFDTAGRFKVRYKSGSTSEGFAEGQVVAYDPFDAAALGLTRIDTTISSRSSITAADVWAAATRTLTAFSFSVDISSTGLAAIWDRLTSAITTVGSIGKLFKDNLDATVSSRSSHSAADIWSVVTRTLTGGVNVTQLNGDSASLLNLQRSAGAIMYGTVLTSGFSPTSGAFESAVTQEATTDHFVGRPILFLTGALAGQAVSITGYTRPGTNGRFAVSTMTDVPANGDAFIIL